MSKVTRLIKNDEVSGVLSINSHEKLEIFSSNVCTSIHIRCVTVRKMEKLIDFCDSDDNFDKNARVFFMFCRFFSLIRTI